MQGTHQIHIAKPKIAKNASNKLPQAFRMQGNSSKRSSEPVTQQVRAQHSEPKQHQVRESREDYKKEKKSKNPFLPIKQFIKKAEQFAKEMREANMDFNMEKFSKYSFQTDNRAKGQKMKYQNCITLSVIRKNMNGCLKKVLHVPTLTVHFLKESLISSHFDKNELTEWIQIINREDNASGCIKILQLFWNMPEDYYSLLYEYSQGLLLDSLNDSLHTLPVSLLKDIAVAHLSSNVGVFNSHLILSQQNGSKVIKYLPLYQESDFTLGQSKKMRSILESEIGNLDSLNQQQLQSKFMWKLGLILLNGYLGSSIMNLDTEKVQLPLKKCCLLHQIIGNSSSLSSLFLSLNFIEDEYLADFLCKCLRSKKCVLKDGRVSMKSLRNSKFLIKKYGQVISLGQMIQVADPSSNIKSKFQISKMNRILDSVSMILQNVNNLDVHITIENKGVIYLAKELGMGNELDKMTQQLKKVYKMDKN